MIKYTFNEITSCKMEICYYNNIDDKLKFLNLFQKPTCELGITENDLKNPDYDLLVLYQNDKIICYCILKINRDGNKIKNIEIDYLSKCNNSNRCENIKHCYILVIFIFDYFDISKITLIKKDRER